MLGVAVALSRKPLILALALIGMLAASSAAQAVTYDKFYTGGTGYAGPYNGVGTLYDATKGLATICPTSTPSCGGADIIADPLTFSNVVATAPGSVNDVSLRVWDDLAPNFGGLGVGTGSPSSSDQIAGTDILILTFASQVQLTGVATLFDSGHTGQRAYRLGADSEYRRSGGGPGADEQSFAEFFRRGIQPSDPFDKRNNPFAL